MRRIASRRTRHQLLPFQKPHNSWDLPNTLPDELVPVAWRFSRSSTIETLKTTFEPAAGGGAMFEQFTERARRVIILAQEEAKRLKHDAVGTEHILLGIVREGEERDSDVPWISREGQGVASKVLESLNISPDLVRAEIETAIGRGERSPYEEVAFTPRAKKVLELALDESRRLKHNYVGTEHLLLGLICEGEGVAARELQAMGADLERVRSQVVRLLAEGKLAPADRLPSTPGLVDRIASRISSLVMNEQAGGISPLRTKWTKVLLGLWAVITIPEGVLLIFFSSFAKLAVWPLVPPEGTLSFVPQLSGALGAATGIASLVAIGKNRWSIARPIIAFYALYAIAAGYVALRRAFAAPRSSQVWLYILLDAFLLAGSLFVLRSQHGLLLPMSLFPAWEKLIEAEEARRKQEES